jgi:DNA-directed RNA polymerase specialized sigma24 family protein
MFGEVSYDDVIKRRASYYYRFLKRWYQPRDLMQEGQIVLLACQKKCRDKRKFPAFLAKSLNNHFRNMMTFHLCSTRKDEEKIVQLDGHEPLVEFEHEKVELRIELEQMKGLVSKDAGKIIDFVLDLNTQTKWTYICRKTRMSRYRFKKALEEVKTMLEE